MTNTISITFDYYGEKEFGKRVFWIGETDDFVWLDDVLTWADKQKSAGKEIIVTNPHDVSPEILAKLN